MKKTIMGAVVVVALFSASGYTAEKLGKECNKDSDCTGGGICLDMAQFGEVCDGKLCTVSCKQSKDCPKLSPPEDYKGESSQGYCEKTNKGMACQWGWLTFDHCD